MRAQSNCVRCSSSETASRPARAARANGVPLPAASLVHQLLSSLEAKGRGEEGTQALYTLYEELSR